MIGIALAKQFESAWDMLAQAINNIPDNLWNKDVGDWYYATTVYHAIETAEFYGYSSPDDMKFGSRAGYSWDDVKDVKKDILPLITKELVNSYYEEIKSKLATVISGISDDTYHTKDGFHWFDSILEKMVYLLRHTMHHIGELFIILRECGCERGKWK